jgi:hypothetical protein
LAQSKLWPKGTLCITIAANIESPRVSRRPVGTSGQLSEAVCPVSCW